MDQTSTVVNPISDQNPVVDPQIQVKAPEEAQPAPGDKTDSALLLKSLQEEREKRRQAEEKARLAEEQLTSSALSDNESDEGKLLRERIERLEKEREFEKVSNTFPKLKEMSQEFETYAADYPRHKLENVAKLFLTEKGFMETPRKGLETTTGGSRVPLKQGLSSDEISELRKNNFRKYREMLLNGELN